MRYLLPALTLAIFSATATAGEIDVLGFNLTENKEVSAAATKSGNPFSKKLSFTLVDGSRSCAADLQFRDVTELTNSTTRKPPQYVNNRPVQGATTERTRGVVISGFAAKGEMECSDNTVLLCDLSAQPEGWKTIDGICASPDNSIEYRILSK
jgi:hypothetical protein